MCPWTHTDVFAASAHCCMYVRACADVSVTMDNADTSKSLCFQLPMLPIVRLDTDPLQTPADEDGTSGGSENVCIRIFLICSGGHKSWRLPLWAYYYAHFIIMLFSLGSHHKHYNEVAVYQLISSRNFSLKSGFKLKLFRSINLSINLKPHLGSGLSFGLKL